MGGVDGSGRCSGRCSRGLRVRRARFILSAGANRDARSSDRVHCRTLNTGHTLSQIQLLDPPCRTRSTKDAPSSSNRRWRCARAGPTVFRTRLHQSLCRNGHLRSSSNRRLRAGTNFFKKDHFLTDQLSKMLVFRSPIISPLTPRALPLGRHTERTPTRTLQCPQTRPSSPSRPRFSILTSL